MSLHCGSSDRLPIRTMSRQSVPCAASTAADPMLCSTSEMMPQAISSREASFWARAKMLAVASIGRPGSGCAEMSPMRRLMWLMSPCMASAETALMSLVFSMTRDSPCSVPPPMPMPPMWRMSSPWHITNEVPVPMLTTMAWSRWLS